MPKPRPKDGGMKIPRSKLGRFGLRMRAYLRRRQAKHDDRGTSFFVTPMARTHAERLVHQDGAHGTSLAAEAVMYGDEMVIKAAVKGGARGRKVLERGVERTIAEDGRDILKDIGRWGGRDAVPFLREQLMLPHPRRRNHWNVWGAFNGLQEVVKADKSAREQVLEALEERAKTLHPGDSLAKALEHAILDYRRPE